LYAPKSTSTIRWRGRERSQNACCQTLTNSGGMRRSASTGPRLAQPRVCVVKVKPASRIRSLPTPANSASGSKARMAPASVAASMSPDASPVAMKIRNGRLGARPT
jgi:hypothetical protein